MYLCLASFLFLLWFLYRPQLTSVPWGLNHLEIKTSKRASLLILGKHTLGLLIRGPQWVLPAWQKSAYLFSRLLRAGHMCLLEVEQHRLREQSTINKAKPESSHGMGGAAAFNGC